jgi:NADH-quinone oxidoreductase subunit H
MTLDLASILPTGNIWLLVAIKFAIAGGVYVAGMSLIAMFSIWWERKLAGHIQSRVGPMHVGGWHGWAQSIADGVKLLQKEDLVPGTADGFMYRLAPYMAFAPVYAAFLILPFGPQLCFDGGFNNGLLLILAVLAVEVMSVILAGWGSNSKWAIYGAMREACQMVSYEIPLGVSLICAILVGGTLNMVELGYLQGGGLWDWFVFHNPFMLAAFLIYFIASLASSKRAPFDLPESESELVAGFHTEYSGIRFSFFFFAEYAGMFVIGVIVAFAFLGGWNSPLGGPGGGLDPVYRFVGFDPIAAGEAYRNGALAGAVGWTETAEAMGLTPVTLAIVNAYSLVWVVLKAYALIFTHMWLRWTLPRIRIDQVLHTCVKVLLPASLITMAGVAIWLLVVPQANGPTDVLGDQHWGHLTGQTPWLQSMVQIACTAVGLMVLLSCVGVVFWAWVHRDKQPKKTLFADVMPVGRDIHFTTGKPGHDAEPTG